jgi:predicted phosphodiesterase
MRLGLLADIHEAVDLLREAIELFRRRGVDEIICLGDFCAMHSHLEETVDLLRGAGVVGVWGNHDFGLCRPADDYARRRFSPELLAYTASLQPRLVRDDCLFTHVEPWLDPNDLMQL